MPISYNDAIKKYADVQGNIVKGHGRDNATFLFIDLAANTTGARQWIGDLLAGTNGQPLLTSTAQQLQDTLRHKADKTFDGGLFASLFLSAMGYQLLGAALPQEVSNQAPFAIRNAAFDGGMRTTQTQSLLNDLYSPKERWCIFRAGISHEPMG